MVVLIIGILAAIALPQYTTAVEKTRAAEALSTLKAINGAQQRYMLENGTTLGVESFDQLDISLEGYSEGTSGIAPRLWNGKNFRYGLGTLQGTAVGAGNTNYAFRLPMAAGNAVRSTKYALVLYGSTNSGYCCWYDAKYKSICTSLGFNNPDGTGWIDSAVGCNNNH